MLFTVSEVAKMLKVNRNFVYNLIKNGELEAVKNGNIILVDNSYFECPTGRITGLISELKSASADIA